MRSSAGASASFQPFARRCSTTLERRAREPLDVLRTADRRSNGRPALALRRWGPLQIPIDPNGNLTSKTEGTDSWVYTWNAENQLTKVEKNGAEVARFAYDPLGRRVEKVAGSVTTKYAYAHDTVLRETRGTALQGPDCCQEAAQTSVTFSAPSVTLPSE
jgi:YD repeat-containing protein